MSSILWLKLIVCKHVIEGVVELIGDLPDLQLLPVDLILNVVNPVVELGDVHLAVLIASLSLLQPLKELVDLVLQLFLTLGGLLSRDLELLHVLTNGLQFVLDILQLALSQLGALSGPLALVLLDTQLPGQLIQLLLVVTGHLGGFSEGLVSILKLNLIHHGLVLKVLDPLQDAIGLLGSISQLGHCLGESAVSLLGLLFHQHDTPGESSNFLLSGLEILFLLLQGLQGLGQLVVGLVKVALGSLDLLAQVPNVSLMLVVLGIGLLGDGLKVVDGCEKGVSLSLQRLHLLPNGVHGLCLQCLVYEATKGDELNQVSKMEAWNQRASLDFDAQLRIIPRIQETFFRCLG